MKLYSAFYFGFVNYVNIEARGRSLKPIAQKYRKLAEWSLPELKEIKYVQWHITRSISSREVSALISCYGQLKVSRNENR